MKAPAAGAAQPEVQRKETEVARAAEAYRDGSAELPRVPESRIEREAEARRLLAEPTEGQRKAETDPAPGDVARLHREDP
jgi:hypothetical protein